ncbi:MAG TPA: hypothetical protein VHF67_13660 [Gaiellaceae bacterium]|nr:hypothetical protein [Gaiellaceae bacterium]
MRERRAKIVALEEQLTEERELMWRAAAAAHAGGASYGLVSQLVGSMRQDVQRQVMKHSDAATAEAAGDEPPDEKRV